MATKGTSTQQVGRTRPQITLGPWLTMDPAAERFVNNDAAKALLTRPYRKPHVVPENV